MPVIISCSISNFHWSELIFFPATWSINFFIINDDIYGFHHSLCSFIENSVSTTGRGISQKYAFIALRIKFPKILPVTKDIAFTSKGSEILYRGLFTSPNFIGSFACFRPQIDSIDNMTRSVYSFSLEMLSKILRVDHHTSHLLNYHVLSFNYSILLGSDRRRKFLLDSI
jgi:hypothetical protein